VSQNESQPAETPKRQKPRGGSPLKAATHYVTRDPKRRVVALTLGALLVGGLLGAGAVAAATPAPTATQEYEKLQARLDATVEAKNEDLNEQRLQISTLRIEKGKLQQAAREVEKQQEDADARDAELAAREAAVGTAETAKRANEFTSGVYLIGTDIQPGQYRNSGGSSCYWERLSGTTGDFSELLANDLPSGPSVVTILPSDVAFSSEGCGTWSKIS
jgi:hypothetical protein